MFSVSQLSCYRCAPHNRFARTREKPAPAVARFGRVLTKPRRVELRTFTKGDIIMAKLVKVIEGLAQSDKGWEDAAQQSPLEQVWRNLRLLSGGIDHHHEALRRKFFLLTMTERTLKELLSRSALFLKSN
jgi:hypothetical protein